MDGVIQDIWQVSSLPAGAARIYPDGCQDVIWVKPVNGRSYWKAAPLDARMRVLYSMAGADLWGARLTPGAQIPPDLVHALDADGPDQAAAAIAALCAVPEPVRDWLCALRAAPSLSVPRLARSLGVSARTLQRQVKSSTGQGPLFWARLMRLRQALSEAQQGLPLAEAAYAAGFADQAHFTREAVAFHAAPPSRLLRDPTALASIMAPGL